MISCILQGEVGLHARPASLFVNTAMRFSSQIMVRNFSTDSTWVNAKSILSVLTLGVEHGQVIEITVEGDDEEKAAAQIRALIENDFPDES